MGDGKQLAGQSDTEPAATRSHFQWTQPCCDACWEEHNPGRSPAALRMPEEETCVYCGQRTESGIYVRIDPARAPYPSLER